jgi:hypothetical protein
MSEVEVNVVILTLLFPAPLELDGFSTLPMGLDMEFTELI